MKRILLFVLLFAGICAQAQIIKPAAWIFTSKFVKPGLYEVHMTTTIEKGWTTYSQWTPEGGPEPTVISFDKNPNILLGGKAKEVGTMKKKHEEVFGVDVHYFEHKVEFVQLVKVKNDKGNKVISGKVKYMTCDKEQCINDEIPFKIELK
ncbi:MAG TPA: protein-disulfide reductase DsbD domain-containing protein [Pedobacter sp.]|uniref:protein-disulfide reductase DsbD domain-containing protein n=1 Tax=Pedobacter sp. TaxID=1411316 RepID=UPI002D1E2535|nr:protein-disulfide reductase DsbD domain-containing protein [Pedobacter sp.]HMI01693.1 protein-disulfide reductase DsbD domain-containing protein [Pedobacter sp.]